MEFQTYRQHGLAPVNHIGIDIGGTFTDCVIVDDAGVVTRFKSPSTPPDFDQGVLDVLRLAAASSGLELKELLSSTRLFAHASTVATNTVVTRSGARVGLLTTRGVGDGYEIARGFRGSEIDAAKAAHPVPLVPREDIEEITERIDHKGAVIAPLSVPELKGAIARLAERGVEAIAVCFLWSFRNTAHERAALRAIAETLPNVYASISSDLTGLLGEYERTSTAVINSYVGPRMRDYLDRLGSRLEEAGLRPALLVMRSDGGVTTVSGAVERPVNLLLSGPAAGIVAAKHLATAVGDGNLITFDMGGTSTDVALVLDGSVQTSWDKDIERQPVAVPMIDIHSVAAGGGSIARASLGTLRVGPESAGARPGPACYGRGGHEPTVTDADLLLGYLDPQRFAGRSLPLDLVAAERAVDRVAEPLGLTRLEAAAGIVEVVDTVMSGAIRVRTVSRGYDPRDFTLLPFGGAGGLHCVNVARMLGISRVIVPLGASTFSALGLLASDLVYSFSVSARSEFKPGAGDLELLAQVNAVLDELAEEVRRTLAPLASGGSQLTTELAAYMCYQGQVLDLEVPLEGLQLDGPGLAALVADFEARYMRIYGPAAAVAGAGYVLRGYRVIGRISVARPDLMPELGQASGAAEAGRRNAWSSLSGRMLPMAVFDGERLGPGSSVQGPALVEYPDTTVLIDEQSKGSVDNRGNLVLELR